MQRHGRRKFFFILCVLCELCGYILSCVRIFIKGFSGRSEKVLPFLLLLFALGGMAAAVINAKNQHGC